MTFLLFNVLFLQLQMLLNLIKNPGVLPLQAHVILKIQDLQSSWNREVEEEGKNIYCLDSKIWWENLAKYRRLKDCHNSLTVSLWFALYTTACCMQMDPYLWEMRGRAWPTLPPHLALIRLHLTNETTGSFAGSCWWVGLNSKQWVV